MTDKDKVVNTEEQNRTVNPVNTENQESPSHQEPVTEDKINRQAENEKTEGGTGKEKRSVEDSSDNERNIPAF